MSSVTVEDLQAQLKLDHILDDALLSLKIEVAEANAVGFTGARIPSRCLAAIKQAVLTLASYWYEVRERELVRCSP